jgi:hypothetical protein
MKAIIIDNLNNGIISFVSFSSHAVMLGCRGTPYIYILCDSVDNMWYCSIDMADLSLLSIYWLLENEEFGFVLDGFRYSDFHRQYDNRDIPSPLF